MPIDCSVLSLQVLDTRTQGRGVFLSAGDLRLRDLRMLLLLVIMLADQYHGVVFLVGRHLYRSLQFGIGLLHPAFTVLQLG